MNVDYVASLMQSISIQLIMLSVVMLSVVMLSVLAPLSQASNINFFSVKEPRGRNPNNPL